MGSHVTPPRLEGRIRLPDGRQIGFAEYGIPTGDPVLWFHGTPGARRQIPQLAREIAEQRNVRLIAFERPGIGDSEPHAYGSVRDWAIDVRHLVDRLGIDRFGLIGLSGGGPYALACAHEMPDRVVTACVLGGVAPSHGDDAPPGGVVGRFRNFGGFVDVMRVPLGVGASVFVYGIRPFKNQMFDLYMWISPEGDKRVFRRPEMREMLLDDLISASRRGVRSLVYDVRLFLRPWGFSVRDIRVPVRFWHGDADSIVPLLHAEHLAALVPDSELRVRAGESHLGTLDAAHEVIDMILELWHRVPENDGPRGARPSRDTVVATPAVGPKYDDPTEAY
jgi:pimeloyl-ACP methyl ester carboxylesterase